MQLVRMFDDQIKRKVDIPGPGYYDHSTADAYRHGCNASAAFNSSMTRELNGSRTFVFDVPGPGSYDRDSGAFRISKKPEHLQFFGSTSDRFTTISR